MVSFLSAMPVAGRLNSPLAEGAKMNSRLESVVERFCWVPLVMFPLIWGGAALAFENEPNGFRGVKAGTDIRHLKQMMLVKDSGDLKAYKKTTEKMSMGEATIDEVRYVFEKGKFNSAIVKFRDSENFNALKEILSATYGGPDFVTRSGTIPLRYAWIGSNVSVVLERLARDGTLTYIFVNVDKLLSEKKAKARKAAKDL